MQPEPGLTLEDAEDSGLPQGLIAAGGDLSRDRLLCAYRQGIFPWNAHDEPLLWWSPDPRMVLFPDELRVTRSLAKTARQPHWDIRWDQNFSAVIRACAHMPRSGQNGTWITPAMQEAYEDLFDAGFAHCIEVWREEMLVGGLYGVALGGVFFGESMFSRVRDASKLALLHLCAHLQQQHVGLIDCQMYTPHLASLGARLISRRHFRALLERYLAISVPPGRWISPGRTSGADHDLFA